jgi:hypothetical protein
MILGAWFLCLTGLFHYKYFSSTDVRQVHIRAIDYPYIGFAVVGFFLLLWGQQDRDLYWEKTSQAVSNFYYAISSFTFEPNVPQTPKRPVAPAIWVPSTENDLRLYVEDLRAYHCEEVDEERKALGQEFCSLISDVITFLDTGNRYEIWAKVLDGFNSFADENGLTEYLPSLSSLQKPTPIGGVPSFSPQYHKRYWYKLRLNRETRAILESLDRLTPRHVRLVGGEWMRPEEDGNKSFFQVVGAIFKFVLWPFILAVSLGLRLTKVTADVTGWAKP